MRIEVVRKASDPERVAQWMSEPRFRAIDAHPMSGGFGRSYYPAVYGEALSEETFAVANLGRPVALVPCSVQNGVLDSMGQPIRVFVTSDADEAASALAAEEAVGELLRLAEARGARAIRVSTAAEGRLGSLATSCLKAGFVAAPAFQAVCDLEKDEAQLFQSLRRRFRSYVNWGRANLRMEHVNAAAARSSFDLYQQFHRRIAGFSTRPQASWDRMFDWIAGGGGELGLGYLRDGGELVAGIMVVDGADAAYYASGVFDRERFDKPIAHWPMFEAILNARRRGRKIFDVGVIPQPGSVSEKEEQIGYFKRGFATQTEARFEWSLARAAGGNGT